MRRKYRLLLSVVCIFCFSSIGAQDMSKNLPKIKLLTEEQCACNLTPVEKKGLYGYSDEKSKILIKPVFEEAMPFHDGIARVRYNGKWGLLNKNGSFAIEPKYDEIRAIYDQNGCAFVLENGKYGFVKKDKEIIKPQFDKIEPYSNYKTLVYLDDKIGILNSSGSYIIRPEFACIWPLQNGDYILKKKSGEFYHSRYIVSSNFYGSPRMIHNIHVFTNGSDFQVSETNDDKTLFKNYTCICFQNQEDLYTVLYKLKSFNNISQNLDYLQFRFGLPIFFFTQNTLSYILSAEGKFNICDYYKQFGNKDRLFPSWMDTDNKTDLHKPYITAPVEVTPKSEVLEKTNTNIQKYLGNNWSISPYDTKGTNGKNTLVLEEFYDGKIHTYEYLGFASIDQFSILNYKKPNDEHSLYKIIDNKQHKIFEISSQDLNNTILKAFSDKYAKSDNPTYFVFSEFYEKDGSIVLFGKIIEEKYRTIVTDVKQSYEDWIITCLENQMYGEAKASLHDYRRYRGPRYLQETVDESTSFKVAVVIKDGKIIPIKEGSGNIRIFNEGLFFWNSATATIHVYSFSGEHVKDYEATEKSAEYSDYALFLDKLLFVGATNKLYDGYWSPYVLIQNKVGEKEYEYFEESRDRGYMRIQTETDNGRITFVLQDNKDYTKTKIPAEKLLNYDAFKFKGESALNGKIHGLGVIDKTGKWFLKPVLKTFQAFKDYIIYPENNPDDKTYIVKNGSMKYGIIDYDGNLVVPFTYNTFAEVKQRKEQLFNESLQLQNKPHSN